MRQMSAKKMGVFLISFALLVLGFPGISESSNAAKSSLSGYLFGPDGTTPVQGAVVRVRNLSTDAVIESTVSDSQGIFRITGLESGIYDYVVSCTEGNFVGVRTFGFKVREAEKEMISITLNSFNKREKSAPKEFPPPKDINDGYYIGRVLSFNTKTQLAEISLERGMLRRKDSVRVLGEKTDFKMKVDKLYSEKDKVDYLSEGDIGYLGMKKNAMEGDALYLTRDKGLLPIFLIFGASAASYTGGIVIGAAKTTAGTKGIVFDIPDLEDECEPVSPFKNKKK